MTGLSTTGSISFGTVFVAGNMRVPKPAAGITAFRTRMGAVLLTSGLLSAYTRVSIPVMYGPNRTQRERRMLSPPSGTLARTRSRRALGST
jgi:hypothetical protein